MAPGGLSRLPHFDVTARFYRNFNSGINIGARRPGPPSPPTTRREAEQSRFSQPHASCRPRAPEAFYRNFNFGINIVSSLHIGRISAIDEPHHRPQPSAGPGQPPARPPRKICRKPRHRWSRTFIRGNVELAFYPVLPTFSQCSRGTLCFP